MPVKLRMLHCLRSLPILVAIVVLILGLNAAPALAEGMMMGREDGMRGGGMRHDGGRRERGGGSIGVGVGVGIGIANEIIRQRAREQEAISSKPRKATKPTKKTKETVTAKKKGKDKPAEAKAPPQTPASGTKPDEPTSNDPKTPPENVAFTPPAFPAITKLGDCEDCEKLWVSILWYERIIAEDMNKLTGREKEVADRKAERESLRASRDGAGTAVDRTYYSRLVEIADNSISELEKLNADLKNLIEREKTILQERLAQYEACFNRYCPKTPVVQTPPSPPPSPPAVVTQPPPTTPVSAPPAPPPGLKPPETPPDDRKICGPDITEYVLDALRQIKKKYEDNPDKQTDACRSLLDPKTAPTAWDIGPLSPTYAPTKGMQYDPATDHWIPDPTAKGNMRPPLQPWFTRYSKMCAKPRPVCGATVEFLGTCQHAQVVNYVQWGMMMELCGGLYPTLGAIAHKLWNVSEYGLTAPAGPQQNMVSVGSEFKDELDRNPAKPDISAIKKRLQERDKLITHDEQNCELKCELTPEQRKALNDTWFSYHWTGLSEWLPRNASTVRDIPAHVGKALDGASELAR